MSELINKEVIPNLFHGIDLRKLKVSLNHLRVLENPKVDFILRQLSKCKESTDQEIYHGSIWQQAEISMALKWLRSYGYVRCYRTGKDQIYSLTDKLFGHIEIINNFKFNNVKI